MILLIYGINLEYLCIIRDYIDHNKRERGRAVLRPYPFSEFDSRSSTKVKLMSYFILHAIMLSKILYRNLNQIKFVEARPEGWVRNSLAVWNRASGK